MREMRGAILALLPVLLLLAVLFGGGICIAVAQSLGYYAPAGEDAFTLSHYAALGQDKELRASLGVTVLWSGTASLLSMILGVALAQTLQYAARGSRLLSVLLQAPIAIPHLAMALVVLNLLGQSGLLARVAYAVGWIDAPAAFPEVFHDRYGAGILLTYVLKETPFVALVALAMLRRIGDDLSNVAATLGASPWQRFRHVTLPLIAPPVVSATLIVFAFLFGAFEVPLLLGRPYPAMLGVVAQQRFMSDDLAGRPGAIAAGVLMSAVSALAVFLYLRLSDRVLGERPTLF